MAKEYFTIKSQDSFCKARTGILELPHGKVSTPVFMPVGTNASVKALSKDELMEIGFEIILANTYHLFLRPGMDIIKGADGLHKFMAWERNILTDSGGFQVFSLSAFRKINEEGVKFRSHIDGSYHFFSPENIVELQVILGSDIQMQLDVCSNWGISHKEAKNALDITTLWMHRALKTWEDEVKKEKYRGLFFPIVQGNFYKDLRSDSAKLVTDTDSPGIAIGGLSVGEPKERFWEILNYTTALLPNNKARYVMGIGTPEYLLHAIEEGIDMFDCVFPTRNARNGNVFTKRGTISLKKAENASDYMPIDEECTCKVCRNYSRAYMRHLFKSREILCSMLASYHNLYFLHELLANAKKAINESRYITFKKDFLQKYNDSNESYKSGDVS